MNAKYLPVFLRNPSFGLLWLSQLLSQGGLRMFQIAFLWWILGQAGERSGISIGLFMVLSALPAIIFVKLIGKVVDKVKTSVVLTSTAICLAILAGILLLCWYLNVLTLPVAFGAAFAFAAVQAFCDPALNKALPQIVSPQEFESAVAMQTSTQSLANFGGAVAGAIIIAAIKLEGTLAVLTCCAISTIFLVQGAFALKTKHAKLATATKECNTNIRKVSENAPLSHKSIASSDVPTEATETQTKSSSLQEFFQMKPVFKWVLAGFALVNFFATPTLVILPIYTRSTLKAEASTLALLEGGLWAGLVFGTFIAPRLNFGSSILRAGAMAIAGLGIFLALPGFVISAWFYTASLYFAGTCLGINNVKFVSWFQHEVPQDIKGQFFALLMSLTSVTFPISFLLFGTLADHLQPASLCLVQGFGVVIVSSYFLFLKNFFEKEPCPC